MTAITRRTLLATSGMAAAAAGLPGAAFARGVEKTPPDLFVGTGGDGHTYPGPTMPFGMVQVGPDTDNTRWEGCSGYHRTDTSIMGFSHTHLSGTGIGDLMDVLVVPARGPVELVPGPREDPNKGYRQRFSEEHAEPGYYRVRLESGVLSELTATERTGWQRHRFPQSPGHVLLDFWHMPPVQPPTYRLVRDATLSVAADGTITGSRSVYRWAKARKIHFALKLSRTPDRVTFYVDDKAQPDGTRTVSGDKLKLVLHYDDAGAAPILTKCGLSGVDVAGALANLEAEGRGWDFDARRRTAAKAWDKALGSIRVSGGTSEQRTILSSAVYHAQLAPTLFSDVDGRYMGLDQKVHQIAAKERAYSTYSLWDTYRTLHPLLTLIAPERATEFTHDLLRQSSESPFGPPVWPLQGVETGTMIGWHAVAVLAEARAKGIPADYAAAWPAIRARAFDPSTPDVASTRARGDYAKLGYLPADRVDESVSRTQEYAYDDWAMAHLAEAAGAHEDAAVLRKRSLNYRNVLDPKIRFARARLADGSWITPYDPIQIGHKVSEYRDYTEANGWQATFLNQHDIYGQIAHFGGDAAFEAKLDALFSAPSTLPDNAPPDISGLVGQYAHGNEPSHHVAYLYAYTGAPWKTQAMVRRLLTEMYKDDPDGVIGNDDCGQMSAWFVMSALGFYPVDPVEAAYVFGSPLFERAEVKLGGTRKLVVEAPGNRPDTPYVAAVTWNGRPWTRSWIPHRELAKGGTLRFTMSATPNRAFGQAPADRPPSYGSTPA
jgi:predicted alpha-1,2-mannosidase